MADVAAAAAAALASGGAYVLVGGRSWSGLESVAENASATVTVAAELSRLSVGAGVRLGGRRAVVALDAGPVAPPVPGELALTTSTECAAAALQHGWTVAQPTAASDVAQVWERAQLLLVSRDGVDDSPDALRPAQRARTWHDGGMAVLVASGAATATLRRLAARLSTRGIEVTALELPLLDAPAHAPLLGGTRLGIGGPETAGPLRDGRWADGIELLDADEPDEASLVGEVLARVRAVPSG